ncbi:hypothetical protein SNEBB_001094 [Seison nebaliae]|nr:hypothetical protein SNEBB_001094 [Seison nebaliae]
MGMIIFSDILQLLIFQQILINDYGNSRLIVNFNFEKNDSSSTSETIISAANIDLLPTKRKITTTPFIEATTSLTTNIPHQESNDFGEIYSVILSVLVAVLFLTFMMFRWFRMIQMSNEHFNQILTNNNMLVESQSSYNEIMADYQTDQTIIMENQKNKMEESHLPLSKSAMSMPLGNVSFDDDSDMEIPTKETFSYYYLDNGELKRKGQTFHALLDPSQENNDNDLIKQIENNINENMDSMSMNNKNNDDSDDEEIHATIEIEQKKKETIKLREKKSSSFQMSVSKSTSNFLNRYYSSQLPKSKSVNFNYQLIPDISTDQQLSMTTTSFSSGATEQPYQKFYEKLKDISSDFDFSRAYDNSFIKKNENFLRENPKKTEKFLEKLKKPDGKVLHLLNNVRHYIKENHEAKDNDNHNHRHQISPKNLLQTYYYTDWYNDQLFPDEKKLKITESKCQYDKYNFSSDAKKSMNYSVKGSSKKMIPLYNGDKEDEEDNGINWEPRCIDTDYFRNFLGHDYAKQHSENCKLLDVSEKTIEIVDCQSNDLIDLD